MSSKTIVVEHGDSDEIVCTLELTEREKDLVEFLLSMRFTQLRKHIPGVSGRIDVVRSVLTKINPANAEVFADKPGDTK